MPDIFPSFNYTEQPRQSVFCSQWRGSHPSSRHCLALTDWHTAGKQHGKRLVNCDRSVLMRSNLSVLGCPGRATAGIATGSGSQQLLPAKERLRGTNTPLRV